MNCADEKLMRRLAFASYRNVTLGTARELQARGAGPDAFFSDSATSLAARTGLKPEYFDDRTRAEAIRKAAAEMEFIAAGNIRAIFCDDPLYPERLHLADDAPAMLYVLGDCSLNPRYSVAIVGTRHATAYGAAFTAELVRDLARALPEGLMIVSGLAYGIDIAAHSAALAQGIPTGAVLAHGLNTIYPADHRAKAMQMVRDGGFLATEYTSRDRTHRGNFLARNRIVAALADAVVVVESDLRGGAMATARLASAYSREVFALPGRVSDAYSRGCNALIAAQTARIVRSADDILDVLGWQAADAPPAQLAFSFDIDPEKTRILRALREAPDVGVNELCTSLAIPYARISAMLFELEMDDLVAAIPGGRFALTADANDFIDKNV